MTKHLPREEAKDKTILYQKWVTNITTKRDIHRLCQQVLLATVMKNTVSRATCPIIG
jgi:hypothetical protein